MPDHPSALGGTFRRPFREQVAFFRQKMGNRVPTARWDDITGAAHDTAFMVAGAQKAELLTDLAVSVDGAIAEGKSLEAFRRDFDAAVEAHDWHGWTGEDTKGGRAWRTRTIYRTNTYTSYAAGRFAQLTAAKWKYWIYLHGGSKDPRPEHLHVFNGLVLPPDHPFWAKFYPPSDWGCSCYVVGANKMSQAKRLGGDPDKQLPAGWDTPDPATGEPAGIGKGWGYAPGASVAGPVASAAGKLRHWDHQLGKAFLDSLPRETRDAIGAAYRNLPSVADDLGAYAAQAIAAKGTARNDPALDAVRTLGIVTTAQAATARLLKPDAPAIDDFEFSIAAQDIAHAWRRHGPGTRQDLMGQRDLDRADFRRIAWIIQAPDDVADAGASPAGEPLLRYAKTIGGELFNVVVAILRGRRSVAFKTMYVRPKK